MYMPMSLWRRSPAAGIVELGVQADGADNVVAGGFYLTGLFKDGLQGSAHAVAALNVEAGGRSVAVDGGVVGEAVVLDDGKRAAPMKEISLDGFAVGVVANAAFSGVSGELVRSGLPGAAGLRGAPSGSVHVAS